MDPEAGPRSASRCFRIELRASDADEAERLAAEAFEAGALGLEEREEAGRTLLIIYARPAAAGPLARALRERAGAGVDVAEPAEVVGADWSERWKRGLQAIPVSPRLLVRPSFVAERSKEQQRELVIDPGQAFGTGSHPSTRLALEWVDALAPELSAGSRVLDVGSGTGVLALAALRLSAARAVALDCDPLAALATRENARRNGLACRVAVFVGTPAALCAPPFELVLANLLSSELAPWLPGLRALTAPGGHAVVSGLLADERARLSSALERAGLRVVGLREARDAGGEGWSALLTRRPPGRASRWRVA